MTFEEAEARFRELQARVQRGEAISRAEYEDQVSRLAVQDQFGVLWEINPRTGKWMYFDGAEWVSGAPPGRETSTVIPLSSLNPQAKTSSTVQPAPQAPPPPMPTGSSVTMRPAMQPARSAAPPPPQSAPTSRAMTPTGARAPAAPEGPRPYNRTAQKPATGRSPLAMFGPGREWIPLAIAAVVLLFCALLLVGVGFVFSNGAFGLASNATPTRTVTRASALAPTNSATITKVALPTPVPPTATPVPVVAKVTERTANVRAAPDIKTGKVVTTMKKDQLLTLVARSTDALWYQINLPNGQAGWISKDVIQISGGDPNALPFAGPGSTPPTPKPGAATPAPKPYP